MALEEKVTVGVAGPVTLADGDAVFVPVREVVNENDAVCVTVAVLVPDVVTDPLRGTVAVALLLPVLVKVADGEG